MVAEGVGLAALGLALVAEFLHARRCRRVAVLAFGPMGLSRAWARGAPLLRVAALGALAWGLATLLTIPSMVHRAGDIPESLRRHLVIVLDVSPSMRLRDAGSRRDLSRAQRASELMASVFSRMSLPHYKISVVAVYSGAIPVVVDTRDAEVVRNILGDLPMHFAFKAGKTDLIAGLKEAARIAQPWNPRSTTLILVSDGDTVPSTGLPSMPPSVDRVFVLGVGDPAAGSFINGGNSRQETHSLRQIALRLGGQYHDGNTLFPGSDLVSEMTLPSRSESLLRLTRRTWALAACLVGSFTIALLPWLLSVMGTSWRPGVSRNSRSPGPDKMTPGAVV